ncbi:non ribosomal peptide synthase [Lojkania enalia]|uniref:Non ribosomal peptide synthase n=1 Tax=Lojkania enalia TaxID=147567 RepID=A0A9P4JYR6_9PLEO|nr:non ribosomal peptide synthase [Didymosphaeria enalia]
MTFAYISEIAFELKIPLHEIDCGSSFIQNGGDSFSAIKLASSCRNKGINISVAMIMGSKSIDNFVREFDRAYVKDRRKDGIYKITKNRKQLSRPRIIPRPLIEKKVSQLERCEATDMQLSLLHGSKTQAGRNVIRYYETYRSEDIPRVKNAWQVLVSTEPIFRTRFREVDNKYCLQEENQGTFIWNEISVCDRDTYRFHQDELDLSVDFAGAAFKVIHFNTEGERKETTVIWNIHHALIDGYSSVLLLNKHRRLLVGDNIQPAPSFVQLIGEIGVYRGVWEPEGREFWMRQQKLLDTAKNELLLPAPGVPFNASYARQKVLLEISPHEIAGYAMNTGVTVASIFYAAWALTLSHFVDSDDVCFGVVLSGRSLPLQHAQSVIGPLINTVPFQVQLDPASSATDFLTSVFKHAIDLDRFQWTMPGHGITKAFPTTLNIHFETPLLENSPLEILEKPWDSIISALPLNVDIEMDGAIQIFYHKHMFFGTDIDRIGKYFAKAVTSLLNPLYSIQECCNALLLNDIHHIQGLSKIYSKSTRVSAWHTNLVELFEDAAMANPNLPAVERDGQAITYSELRAMSAIIASQLVRQIGPNEVVCVHADRSINWVIAIYGILKAGAVYCPLDEALPHDIRSQNFSTSGSRIFLTGASSDKSFAPATCTLSLSIEELLNHQEALLGTRFLPNIEPGAAAYLCFSSGSTGKPKGIICSHNSLVAFQSDINVRLMARPNWRVAQVMSPAFDGSIHEIFSALSYGSTLVLKPSTEPFGHLSNVDSAILTPSIAKVLDPEDFSLKVLYLVGETVPQEVCDKWASRMLVYNMYGPTEATCGATIKKLEPRKDVTLGKPNLTTRVYILSSRGQFVPPGVIGELYLAGIQVSQGYVQRPDETAKRFVPDTICPEYGERMYRTGDRGYWDSNGELRFCGRNDRQIKLRGFRVDLDDIEIRIQNTVPGCTAAAVTRHNDSLVALLQPENLHIVSVREQLARAIPVYAMPRHIVPVSRFPHTNAGKLDYKHIMEVVEKSHNSDETEVRSELLTLLSNAWKDILGLPEGQLLTLGSNFLDLGGHSIHQLQLANKLSALLGRSVPLVAIVQSPTLGDLATRLADISPSYMSNSRAIQKVSIVSPIEEDWWNKYKYSGGSSAFNVTALFQLGEEVDLQRLCEAWNFVLSRHIVLKSRYSQSSAGVVQRHISEKPPHVMKVLQIDIDMEINYVFDLSKDDLIKVLASPNQVLMVASHIICDYTSLNAMLHEVSEYYLGRTLQPPKQYHDRISINEELDAQKIQFWRHFLRDYQSGKQSIGTWSQRNQYSGASRLSQVPISTFRKLRQFASTKRVTAHQISLAAVALALQHDSDNVDIVLGAPHLGRTSSGCEDVVGLFLEPLPIRIRHATKSSSPDQKDFIRSVQESSQSALCHALPWNVLLESLGIVNTFPDNPILEVMVSYHDGMGKMGMTGIDAKSAYTWTRGAKFKLMVEFLVANEESLIMRLEYSDECFDEADISTVERLIAGALDMLANGLSQDDIMRSLRLIRNEEVSCEGKDHTGSFFGVAFEDL